MNALMKIIDIINTKVNVGIIKTNNKKPNSASGNVPK